MFEAIAALFGCCGGGWWGGGGCGGVIVGVVSGVGHGDDMMFIRMMICVGVMFGDICRILNVVQLAQLVFLPSKLVLLVVFNVSNCFIWSICRLFILLW